MGAMRALEWAGRWSGRRVCAHVRIAISLLLVRLHQATGVMAACQLGIGVRMVAWLRHHHDSMELLAWSPVYY